MRRQLSNFARGITGPSLALLAVVVLLGGAAGCARPAGVIFAPLSEPLVWPTPPEAPRIAYVGQLSTSADLKPAVPFFQGLGQAIFGKRAVASMLSPYAVCTDGADRVFVADNNGQLVHVFNLATRKYEQWRPTGELKFTQPVGIAYDPAGRLLVADSLSGVVFVFDAAGAYQGQLGAGEFQRPCGVAVDPRTRRIFVADVMSHQILIFSPDGRVVSRLGQRGPGPGEFNFPTNVAIDGQGRLYVSDSLNFRVQQFSADLKPLRQIGSQGDMPGSFSQPKGLAVDSEGHLYVIDSRFENVQVFRDDGRLLMDFGEEGNKPGQFWLPAGIFVDVRNRIWVADSYNRRVQVFDYLPEKRP